MKDYKEPVCEGPQCQCGSTSNEDGTCDGTHLQK